MEHHHISAQLKQLLKQGYSIEDIRNLIVAPRNILDTAIQEFLNEQKSESSLIMSQQNQASYAMGLKY